MWGHHFTIQLYLFLQWDYSLAPFLAAALHTTVLWDQQTRYLPGCVSGNLMLLTRRFCGSWLRPCLAMYQSPLAHPALSGEALQTSPLWTTLFSNKRFHMRPHRLLPSLLGLQLSNVLWISEQPLLQNILYNSRAAACSTLPGNDRYDSMSLEDEETYIYTLELTTEISTITKYNFQLVATSLLNSHITTRVSIICVSVHLR